MRFVIYDDETLEPITVVNLRGVGWKDIERRGRHWRVTVPSPPPTVLMRDSEVPPKFYEMRIVDLWFERFRRKDQESWMCFTKQTDLAMLLLPDWLPGQRATIDELERHNEHLVEILLAAVHL